MGNNTTDNKLDEIFKNSLDSYEANYDAGDWSRMERMLDAAPKSIASKGSYKIAIIVGAIVLAGGFFIYKGIDSAKNNTESTNAETPTPAEVTKEIAKPTPAPKPLPKEIPVVKSETLATPVIKPTVIPEPNTAIAETEKAKKEKKQKATEKNSDFQKNQKVTIMGNEPIFGDMIDSSKGIIRETKEKESTKKAAKAKGTSGIGLSGLMNLNADSIKKQKEQMQKDSTLQK
ncbi:MAG: hypothetical protein H0X46_04635 [Bacteroidetes bacterium]|nr:hypothetical protein [Bacteroidota bacterium]